MPIYYKKSMTTTKICRTVSKLTMVCIYDICDNFSSRFAYLSQNGGTVATTSDEKQQRTCFLLKTAITLQQQKKQTTIY